MKRKLLSVLLITMLLAAALTGCGGGGTTTTTTTTTPGSEAKAGEETFTWRMQAIAGTGTLFHTWTVQLADLITTMSGGRLTVKAFGGGEIVDTQDMPTAVRDGALDAALSYSVLWTHEYGMPLFTSNPGEFSSAWDIWYWIKHGGGYEIWRDALKDFDVQIFVGGLYDTENFLWSQTPVKTIDDLKKLKFRMMPLGGDILTEQGCSVVFMSGGEIIPSLERGVIDAAEYAISAIDITLGMHDAAKYYHKPGWHQPCFVMEFVINGKNWRALPPDLQAIVEAAADVNCIKTLMQCPILNSKAEVAFQKNGNEMVMLSDEFIKQLYQWTEEWYDKMKAKDPFIKRVKDSQKNFMQWWVPYQDARRIPYPDWAYERANDLPYELVPLT